ncbi:hypothetical protein BMF94_1765 [Rhodotorula taiwanensis]|uniref:SET domain-containing protein n=1 Tax=Rhodotorula taiwanensis TaxID=741276 RepID=A0A2S5BED7_9BASI|nr:hypothetical protein BMF94_1765 [Rhodotorula taiwanensis]
MTTASEIDGVDKMSVDQTSHERRDGSATPTEVETTESDATDSEAEQAREVEDNLLPASSSNTRQPEHYPRPRKAPTGLLAARKSAYHPSVPVRATKKRTRALGQAGTRRTAAIVKREEEDVPAPSWPLSPAKPSTGDQLLALAAEGEQRTDAPFGLTFPFSLQVRLEEVRLSAALASSRPRIELGVAFRHIDQRTQTASVAACAIFELGTPSSSDRTQVALLHGCELPPVSTFVVHHLERPPEPGALVVQDVRDVGIRIVISNKGQQADNYHAWVPLQRAGRVQNSGVASSRRAADGTQVVLSWTMSPTAASHGADRDALVTEGDVERLIEEELRACERSWRLEVANRAILAQKIEAGPVSSYGPPDMLFYPSEAPAPGALIPGLADTTPLHSASLQFAPVPRYSYTAFSTRAIPVAGHKLEAFPWLPVWEDSAAANAILAEKVKCFLPPGVDDTTELSVNDPRLDWLRDALLDLEAFQAPDVGRTIRDYQVLQRLEERLASESSEGDGAEVQTEKRLAALQMYKRRVGRSANEVIKSFGLITRIDTEAADDQRPEDCEWCGAVGCTVHACYAAYNRPKKPAPLERLNHPTACEHCGHEECVLIRAMYRMDVDEASLRPDRHLQDRLGSLDPCSFSLITGVPNEDTQRELAKPNPPIAHAGSSFNWQKESLQPYNTLGYTPCSCEGACDEDCACVFQSSYCDEYCNCPPSCPRRYRGCSDRICRDNCWCYDRGRECNPRLCACSASTCKNSRIRLSRYKATVIVRSQLPGAGYGLAMLEPVACNELLGVYGGESFSQDPPADKGDASVDRVWGAWRAHMADANPVSYWFEIDQAEAVDSVEFGGNTRYINHHPDKANVEARIINIAGTHQVAVYATQDLQAGAELFMDYGPSYFLATEKGHSQF